MQGLYFNTVDLVLISTSLLSVIFGTFLLVVGSKAQRSNMLLAAFLFAFAMQPMHKLVVFGEFVRPLVMSSNLDLFFAFSLGYALEGALIYFYVRSVVLPGLQFRLKDLWHLSPLIIYATFIYFAYYQYDESHKYFLMESHRLIKSASYRAVSLALAAHIVVYLLFSLKLLKKHSYSIKNSYSNTETVSLNWVMILISGMLIIRTWRLLSLSTFILADSPTLAWYFGVTSNYIELILIITLLFSSFRYIAYSHDFAPLAAKQEAGVQHNPEHVAKLTEYMASAKPYIDPNLTISALADALSLSTRTLSALINGHFSQNFYDFINSYRIEEVKKLFSEPEFEKLPIERIYLSAGFNSRSVFNTLFKELVGETPSQYRKRLQNKTSPLYPDNLNDVEDHYK